ncbi:MAG: serine/threonine-protein kinase, partial [Solirubrobacteraceae bacterium]
MKRLIGRGGMGVVFLARDRRLERLVAIKTLPPMLSSDAALRERFLRETRTAGGMSHPNIVPIHGADEVDGHVFFVMSYIEGESLATLVRANGRLEARAVARYLRDVASALAHAHQRGIIHRDIKAENILVERASDRAMVTDFGIARLADATPLTATGQVLGTVYYVSPEQVSGEPVDARGDFYSLGVVGYFALTGQFPFDADVASAVLVAHVTKPAPPVATIQPSVPPALALIVDRCLSKNPAHRYTTADDLLAALDAAIPELERAPKR